MPRRRRETDHNYYVPEQPARRRRKRSKKKGGCFKSIVLGGAALLFAAVLLTPSENSDVSLDPTPTPGNFTFFAQESAETPAPTATPVPHIYDNAEIRDVHNGFGTEVIGKFSLIRAPYASCTEEALADWYYNHVKDGGYNWCMILYSDRDDLSGVFCNASGLIEKDVKFEEDSFNQYRLGDASNETIYIPSDGALKVFNNP